MDKDDDDEEWTFSPQNQQPTIQQRNQFLPHRIWNNKNNRNVAPSTAAFSSRRRCLLLLAFGGLLFVVTGRQKAKTFVNNQPESCFEMWSSSSSQCGHDLEYAVVPPHCDSCCGYCGNIGTPVGRKATTILITRTNGNLVLKCGRRPQSIDHGRETKKFRSLGQCILECYKVRRELAQWFSIIDNMQVINH